MKLLYCSIASSLAAIAAAQNATFHTNATNPSTSMNGTFGQTGAHNVRYDTGLYGPPVEEYHYCAFLKLPIVAWDDHFRL